MQRQLSDSAIRILKRSTGDGTLSVCNGLLENKGIKQNETATTKRQRKQRNLVHVETKLDIAERSRINL